MHCLEFCVKRSPLSSRSWKQICFDNVAYRSRFVYVVVAGCEFGRADFFYQSRKFVNNRTWQSKFRT